MPWQKGQSGNPDGRTKKAMAILRQMEGLTFKAVKAYEQALDEGTISEKMAAANAVMDRVLGKPKQQTALEVQHSLSPHLSALVGYASAALARGTTVPEIDAQVVDFIDVSGNDAHNLIEHVDAETGITHDD